MKLASFLIKNFKSIVDTGTCKISTKDNIIILAGQNESGKSATLEALDFFRNGPNQDFQRLYRRQKENAYVECMFELEDQDIPTDTNNPKLEKFLKEKKYIILERGLNSTNNQIDYENIHFSQDFVDKIKDFFPNSNSTHIEEENSDSTTGPIAGNIPDDGNSTKEVPGDNVQQEKERGYVLEDLEKYFLEELRLIVFYTDFPQYLPGVVKLKDIPNYPAVLDFQKVFNIDFATLLQEEGRTITREVKKLNERASDDLNKYWTQKLDDENKYEFVIEVNPQYQNLEESEIKFLIDRQNDDPLYMEQKSKGFRWFSSFNLKLRAHGLLKEDLHNLILLIDEPGQGLHEKAQTDAKKVLEEIATNGAQIIYSTHNPNLIGTEGPEFSRIRLVSNNKTAGTRIQNISQYNATSGSADALSPIRTALGLNSIQLLSDPSKYNIVVEGITDHFYLTAVRKLFSYNDNLFFLPACGVSQVPNVLSILIGWNLNYKAILDGDSAGKRVRSQIKSHLMEDEDTTKKNVFIKENYHGIEDIFSKEDFKTYVLTDDLKEEEGENSLIAKKSNKKEFLARMFLDKVTSHESIELNSETKTNIQELFNWLYEQFSITI